MASTKKFSFVVFLACLLGGMATQVHASLFLKIKSLNPQQSNEYIQVSQVQNKLYFYACFEDVDNCSKINIIGLTLEQFKNSIQKHLVNDYKENFFVQYGGLASGVFTGALTVPYMASFISGLFSFIGYDYTIEIGETVIQLPRTLLVFLTTLPFATYIGGTVKSKVDEFLGHEEVQIPTNENTAFVWDLNEVKKSIQMISE